MTQYSGNIMSKSWRKGFRNLSLEDEALNLFSKEVQDSLMFKGRREHCRQSNWDAEPTALTHWIKTGIGKKAFTKQQQFQTTRSGGEWRFLNLNSIPEQKGHFKVIEELNSYDTIFAEQKHLVICCGFEFLRTLFLEG